MGKTKEEIKKSWKKFWAFLKKDSWTSLVVILLIAFILIKFVFFPILSMATGTSLPIVIVESCSMYHHEKGFEKTFQSNVYSDYGISIEDTIKWPFKGGLNKGDIIFVVGVKNPEVGDIIIFNGGASYPLIHRVIKEDEPYSAKGDNYKTNSGQLASEKQIQQDQIIGKAVFRIPFLGWSKLIFFEPFQPAEKRGFC